MPMFFRVIGSICLLAFAAQATAQQGPKAQQIFGSILGGYYDDASDLDLRKGGDGIGGAIGIGFTDNLAIELSYLEFKPGVKVDSVRGDGDLGLTSLNMLYSIGNGQSWQPYLTFGGGHGKFKYDGLQGNKNEPIVNVGAGFFTNLTPRVAFRTDVRGLYHTGAGSVSPMATVGLTLMIGGAKPAPVVMAAAPVDSDGDGVTDGADFNIWNQHRGLTVIPLPNVVLPVALPEPANGEQFHQRCTDAHGQPPTAQPREQRHRRHARMWLSQQLRPHGDHALSRA